MPLHVASTVLPFIEVNEVFPPSVYDARIKGGTFHSIVQLASFFSPIFILFCM